MLPIKLGIMLARLINTHNTSNGINMVENNESSVVNDAKTL